MSLCHPSGVGVVPSLARATGECTRYALRVLRGRWFGWGLGALCLVGTSHCGGKAERSRHGAVGSGGDTGTQTRGTRADGGTSPTQFDGSTGGTGGGVPNILEACPDQMPRPGCPVETYVEEMLTQAVLEQHESSCGFSLVNEYDQVGAPLIVVDCEPVHRFNGGEGGAAGWNDERENYTWDPDTSTVTFLGSWCEELASAERVDVIYYCGEL